jgi:LemA protein
MKKGTKTIIIIVAAVLIVLIGFGRYTRTYNMLESMDENIDKAWANVESVYQRRMDLIPNLVNTVKGYAEFEKETLTQVTEARSKVSQMKIDPSNLDVNAIAQFQQNQGALSSALSRLMVVMERYPDLKANQNFLDLQAQLEGTENRISVERRKYNEVVNQYNKYIRRFWVRAFFSDREKRGYFKAEPEAAQAPTVEF